LLLSATFANAAVFDLATTQAPELRTISLESFSAEKNTAVFAVTLYNSNPFKIPVREMTSRVHLNDIYVATVDASSKKSLAPHEDTLYKVPVEIKPEALQQAINMLITTHKAHYPIEAYLMTPVGEIPISRESTLSTDGIILLLSQVLR
jgi:LEA14-like dessication related protein